MLASRSEVVTSQVESRTKAAAESLNARLEQLAQSVSQNTGEAERSMSHLASTSTEAMRNAAAEAERVLSVVSTGIGSALKQNASDVERTLLSVSAEVSRGFVGKADEIAAAVSARASEMTRVLDANSSTLLAALSAKSGEFTNEVQRATQSAVSAIESKGFDFTRTMLDNSNELARVINDAGETATARVNQTMQNLHHTAREAIEQSQRVTSESVAQALRTAREAIEQSQQVTAETVAQAVSTTREAIEQSQRVATESVNQVMETHARLRGESTTLFERMREANVLLHEVLTAAHENMATIEGSLTSRVSEFANAMNDVTTRSGVVGEQINAHVESFRTDTAEVLQNLSDIAAQFAHHGRTLVQAVEVVEKSNRRTEETVGERRAALETLVATLDVKSEDLEQRLQRFTALLDQSLGGAEERAREIGRMIAESSTHGTRAIAEQFELVREATEQEGRRTSDLMRTIYEQSIGETDSMFRQSSERFAETLAGMRDMAAQMQLQLEQTRAELRRGILELPQETAETAAQMRRVIVDQIEALAELNRIVSRHGRSIEATEPRRAAEPVLAVVGGRTEARPQARHPEHPQGPAPRPAAPPAPPQAYPQQAAPQGGRNQGGWLSDLLQGADERQGAPGAPAPGRQMPPSAPQRPLDSLDALSADIARLVEHDAAIDMWDRYNRGERNAFTRQLYTMNGQRAFDDIRNRYRADRNFRATVDRYIAEFERLLEDVSRDERGGQAMVRTYLISETGKVYTMLAHAAGRFD
jgi:hypothetical protein